MAPSQNTTTSAKPRPAAQTGKPTSSSAPQPEGRSSKGAAPKATPGDGCRTEKQKLAYPFGRGRVLQFIANSLPQKHILDWILAHPRLGNHSRHTALWRLLEAGWEALRGHNAQPPLPPSPQPSHRTTSVEKQP